MLTRENGFTLPLKWKFPEANKVAFSFITLFITLLLIYSNSFYGEWHFDDTPNIVDNPYIKIKSFSWSEIKHCIYGLEQARPSRPLSYLSFALNNHFHGMDVFGFHVVNFTIHYLAAVFLFLFIYNTLKLPRLKDRYENIAYPVALLATFFWAIHPIFVTSVSYIVQRMTTMAGMFYILSMYCYLKARTAEKTSYVIVFFIGCALAGLAAVLTKENAVLLPVSILLFDLFLIQGVSKKNVKKMLKISILPFVIILFIALIYTGGFSLALGGFELRDFTMVQRILTEPRVILFYLSLLFYPINSRMTLLYDIDVSRTILQPWTTIPSILLIVFIIAFAFYIAKKRPLLSFCIIFYFLNHLIEGTVFSLELIFEHRNYLPAMLLFIPVAEFIISAIDYFSYRKLIQFTVALGVIIILIGLGDNTFQRNAIFSSDFYLWFDNINKSPKLSRPHANLGRIYFNSNMSDKALAEYEKATALNSFGSEHALAIQYYNLGLLYFAEMKDDLALNHFQKSSAIVPEYIQNTIHVAKIKMRQNKISEARQIIKDKLTKYPGSFELMEFYSFILLKYGKINESQYFAKKCLMHNANSIFSLQIMAEICRQKNNYASAISYWKSLRLLSPRYAFTNLALIELYANINDHKMLNQEIQLLFCLKDSLNISEYIKELTKDEMLLVYVPNLKNLSFLLKKSVKQFI